MDRKIKSEGEGAFRETVQLLLRRGKQTGGNNKNLNFELIIRLFEEQCKAGDNLICEKGDNFLAAGIS